MGGGGLGVSGLATLADVLVTGHIRSSTTAPTLSAQSFGGGITGTLGVGSTDVAGVVNLSGAGSARVQKNDNFSVTFATPFASAPSVVVSTGGTSKWEGCVPVVLSVTATAFSVVFTNKNSNPFGADGPRVFYQVVGFG